MTRPVLWPCVILALLATACAPLGPSAQPTSPPAAVDNGTGLATWQSDTDVTLRIGGQTFTGGEHGYLSGGNAIGVTAVVSDGGAVPTARPPAGENGWLYVSVDAPLHGSAPMTGTVTILRLPHAASNAPLVHDNQARIVLDQVSGSDPTVEPVAIAGHAVGSDSAAGPYVVSFAVRTRPISRPTPGPELRPATP